MTLSFSIQPPVIQKAQNPTSLFEKRGLGIQFMAPTIIGVNGSQGYLNGKGRLPARQVFVKDSEGLLLTS